MTNTKNNLNQKKQKKMAQVISPNAYQIDGADITPARYGFPVSSVVFSPAPAGTITASGVSLYGIIEPIPTGLQVLNSKKYYTIETVAQLAALANA